MLVLIVYIGYIVYVLVLVVFILLLASAFADFDVLTSVHLVQIVSHKLLLGVHIEAVVVVRLDFDGHVLYNFEAIALESYALDGIVGEQPHLAHTYHIEYLCTHAVIAFVGAVAQVYICFHGVHTLFLELVGTDFVHQSDAATFLAQVDDGAATLFFDGTKSLVQLLAAVTALRSEDVAGGAG